MYKKSIKYHKLIFFTRTELKGKYRYKDEFQIYPIKGEGYPYSKIQKHFPNYMELKTSWQDDVKIQTHYPEMDELMSEIAPGSIKQDMILDLLTTCSNHLFFRYENSSGSWALPITSEKKEGNKDLESIWCHPVYGSKKTSENNAIINFTDQPDFDEVEQVKFSEYFLSNIDPDKHFSGPIKFVSIIDAFLLSYFNLSNDIKPIVNQAMYHFRNGVELSETKKTLSLLSLFTSLETMVDLEHRGFKAEQCESCGQQKFKISKKFRDFLTKYVSSKSKSKFNKLYSLRSKIVHTGKLLESEFLYSEASLKKKEEENLTLTEVIQICRLSIVNWVTKHQIAKQSGMATHNT